jgi:NTP pyrophosphatase (non-canonical NTP hydrolase)
MTFDEYQMQAFTYAKQSARCPKYLFTGAAGEIGELCSLYAKAVRDDYYETSDYQSKNVVDFKLNLAKELGDVLWFVASLAHYYGFSLHEIAEANINKLEDRKKRNVIGGSGDKR